MLDFLQMRSNAFTLAVSENSIVGLCNVKSIMDLGSPRSATQCSVVEGRSACEGGVHGGSGSDNDRAGTAELRPNPIAGCRQGRLYSGRDLASRVGCQGKGVLRRARARCDVERRAESFDIAGNSRKTV